ncbi:M56 family metallopeptidase [Algoriphagus sp.]|uniref:M56 family metallopeptidase n=1 Tax=Algoriphagus sp. TaxID=1872435 RepID=UPI003F6FA2DA
MITYLLKSITCLLILLLAHRLLLQREVLHRFNRFFLLFSVVASFLIPLYTIEVPQEVATASVEVNSEPVYFEAGQSEVISELVYFEAGQSEVISEPVYFEAASQEFNQNQVVDAVSESQFNWVYLLFGLYGLISLIFFFRFVRNIKILVNKIQRNIKINYRDQTLVLLKEESLPFSFLKYIFVAESDFENGKFTDAVFSHEQTHIKEKHSWDNLFIELLLIPLWFHPGLYWAKAAIKLNHEFIADKVALRSTPLEKYETQLLTMMLSEQKYGLASSLNFSLTKKRFEMMKRKSVSGKSWIKLLVLVPVFGALVYFFSERVAAQEDKSTSGLYINASIEEDIDFDLTLELKPNGVITSEGEEYNLEKIKELILERKEINDDLKINLITNSGLNMGDLSDFQAVLRDLDIRRIYYKGSNLDSAQEDEKARHYSKVKFLVENEEMGFTERTYSELSDKQRSMLILPPAPPQKRSPSDSAFQAFIDEEQFNIWLDGKEVSKKELEKIKPLDIAYFSSFPYYGDANSGSYPQHPTGYNASFVTYKSFDNLYGSGVSKMNTGKGTVTIAPGSIWLVDISLYANPETEFQEKYAEYEKLRNTEPHYIYKARDEQSRLTALYYELTGMYYQFNPSQKAKVTTPITPIFPYLKLYKDGEVQYKLKEDLTHKERKQLSSPPPSAQKEETSSKWPPAVKAAQIQNNLQSYKEANTAYEKLRKQAPHFVKRSKAEQEKLTEMFSELGSMYFLVAFHDKPKVKYPVRPFTPYIKLESNGEVYYKMGRDLTAEELKKYPPPPPATPEEQVEAYKKVFYQYELMRNKGRNHASLSMEEREDMFLLYNELQLKFLAMGAPERRQVKMVNFPYYRVEEDGKMVFKAIDELTPEQRALNNC